MFLHVVGFSQGLGVELLNKKNHPFGVQITSKIILLNTWIEIYKKLKFYLNKVHSKIRSRCGDASIRQFSRNLELCLSKMEKKFG